MTSEWTVDWKQEKEFKNSLKKHTKIILMTLADLSLSDHKMFFYLWTSYT